MLVCGPMGMVSSTQTFEAECFLAPGHADPLVRPAMTKDVGHPGYDAATGTVTEPGTPHSTRVSWPS